MTTGQATSDPIPLVSQLCDVYSKQRLAKEGARWEGLRRDFETRFGSDAEYIARAPGRVNLMGE